MQKTGNIDPVTGKEEYVYPNGEKIYLSGVEMDNLKSLQSVGFPTNAAPAITPAGASGGWDATAPKTNGVEVLGSDEAAPEPLMGNSQQPPTPTPSGMVDVSESQRTSKVIPKDVLKKQELAFKKADDALSAKMDAETSLANATALKAQEEAAISQRFLDQEAEKQSREQADIERRQSELDAISAEYSNMEIDSNNYWAKKSTGDSILAALAIGLGTFGHVASGAQGESPVLKILQSKIDQDIEIQKANIAKAGNNVSTQRGLFSDVLKRTGDERLARLKTHELGIKSALAQFDQQIAKSNNELVMAKYQQEKAAMENELANNLIAQSDQLVVQSKTAPREAPKPTVGQEMYEKKIAEDLVNWENVGQADAMTELQKLRDAAKMLEDVSKGKSSLNLSGNVYGRLPEFFKSNDALGVQQRIQSAAMGALKATLGSQFTQREGEQVQAFAFDPKVDEKENLRRVNELLKRAETVAAVRNAQFKHFQENGRSMAGWKGANFGSNDANFKEQKK